MRTFAVINPHSAGGRTGRAIAGITAALERVCAPLTVAVTTGPRDAEMRTRQALRGGFERIVAVGGDGTVNEVVNGFFEGRDPVNTGAEFSLLELGTGGDFGRTFGLPGNLEPAVARIASGTVRPIDVGHVLFRTASGVARERYFANIASFGLSGDVTVRANRALRLKAHVGGLVFPWAAVTGLLRPQCYRVRLALDRGRVEELDVATVAVCNGEFFGGGMHMAPGALPDDGLFDVVVVLAVPKLRLLRTLRLIFSGKHIACPFVRRFRARSVVAEPVAPGQIWMEVDGETPGAMLPVRFDVVPGAIRFRC
ncbi:MAG: diacylglycerol/lipid kinase family protein [Gemmatimonadaceae bacterium]